MPKVYNQPINKLKRTVTGSLALAAATDETRDVAVRQQDAKLLHAAFVSFVQAEKANAEELQELVKTANEAEKREKAVKADLDAIYEELQTASDAEKAAEAEALQAAKEVTEYLELEAEKIESAFEDVSDEARGVPAIYERARALSRNLESLDECMSRLRSLALENPDVTYDDFTYKRIVQACVTYANAPIATQAQDSIRLDMQLDMQLAAIADALRTLETMDKPIVDPTFTDKALDA